MTTVLYPERLYPDDSVERAVFGRGVTIRVECQGDRRAQ